MNEDSFDPQKLALPSAVDLSRLPPPTRKPRQRQVELFVKGPIPVAWLAGAARLSGKALAVGVAIWFLAGLTKTTSGISLTGTALAKLGISRKAAYRGLHALEDAGLVNVKRHAGRSPVVTISEAPKQLIETNRGTDCE